MRRCFRRFHGLQRVAESMIGARLHFDKNDNPAVKHDQIDFAAAAAIVALDERIALFL